MGQQWQDSVHARHVAVCATAAASVGAGCFRRWHGDIDSSRRGGWWRLVGVSGGGSVAGSC